MDRSRSASETAKSFRSVYRTRPCPAELCCRRQINTGTDCGQRPMRRPDYNNGTGTGNVLWLMGLGGAFAFNNIYADPYPWFSHQHDAEIYNTATGEFTVFDNGTTRVAPPPIGLGSGNSRGMVY